MEEAELRQTTVHADRGPSGECCDGVVGQHSLHLCHLRGCLLSSTDDDMQHPICATAGEHAAAIHLTLLLSPRVMWWYKGGEIWRRVWLYGRAQCGACVIDSWILPRLPSGNVPPPACRGEEGAH